MPKKNPYGAYGEKKLYGKVSIGVLRSTSIINEQGMIEAVIKAVKTKEATEQVLKKFGPLGGDGFRWSLREFYLFVFSQS